MPPGLILMSRATLSAASVHRFVIWHLRPLAMCVDGIASFAHVKVYRDEEIEVSIWRFLHLIDCFNNREPSGRIISYSRDDVHAFAVSFAVSVLATDLRIALRKVWLSSELMHPRPHQLKSSLGNMMTYVTFKEPFTFSCKLGNWVCGQKIKNGFGKF
jgi:hypothetical protein